MSEVWTVGKVVRWATDDFKSRGLPSPRLDAELLLSMVLGIDRIKIITDDTRPLSRDELARYKALILRRRAHEPIAYLRGEREFYGRSFNVTRDVLIPRPDTEVLVEVALRRTRARNLFARVVDVCTGSGCVAITLAKERPTWRIGAFDLSPQALEVAKRNAQRLGGLQALFFRAGDLLAPLGEPRPVLDLITANPPYIPEAELSTLDADVRDFEPHLALSGGDDGFSVTRRLVPDAFARLVPGGVLATEIMAGTSTQVIELFERAGFGSIEMSRDYAGHDRVVSGVKP